eukprot:g6724.t1
MFALVAPPPAIGVFLGSVPVWMGYGLIYFWLVSLASEQPVEKPTAVNFEGHAGDWQDQAILDLDRIDTYRVGRIGTSFLFMGMYLTMMGCKMFVPESADDHADDDTMAEVGGDAEALMDDDDEEMLPPSEFWTPLLWKRTHMLLSCYITCGGCLFIWEFSYSESFSKNVNQVIIALKFVQMMLDQALASYLRENLLIAPILVTIEITEIMITMGSDSLVDFIQCYGIELLVMILERLYMDPGMKYAAKLMPKWQMMFKHQTGLWSRRSLQGTVDDEIAAKLAIGEGRQEDLEAERLELQAMNSERFRHRFLDRSRPWVLQHLVELLTPRTLQMPGADGRPVIEYIRDVYTDLMNMGEGRRRPGDRADISSDEGDDDLENMRRHWSKAPLSKPSAALLRYWLERARMRRKLHKLVQGTIKRAVTDTCALCGRTTASGARMRCDLAMDGRADDYALDKLIKGYEETYPDREFDPNLWQSYFRQHASFITRCEQCINLAEQAKKKAPSRRPGKGRGTRAQDISDDDDSDEEQAVFEPMVVTRTSVEGKAMSKWLNAARRRLGGNFPRPNARAEMEAYAQKMRDYKLKKAREEAKAKGLISDDDDFDESSKMEVGYLNAATKALCKLWLIRARASLVKEKEKRLENIRKELKRVSGLVTEEDDWFYGSELRLQGVALKQEGAELDETRRQLTADANSKSREVRDELEEFENEKNRQMEEEIAEIQEKMNLARQKAMEKAEERIQEITRNKTRKAALYEKEEKLAPPEDRTKLVAQHKIELKKLDEAVASERAKQSEILAKAEMAGKDDLSSKQTKRDQALKDKRDIVERKCKQLLETVEESMKGRERDWQNRVNGWVLKAQRKIKSKEADDAAKAAKEADRKKRRKLRK